MHAVFQLIVIWKIVSSECILQGAKKGGNLRCLYWDCGEDKAEQVIPFLHLPPL